MKLLIFIAIGIVVLYVAALFLHMELIGINERFEKLASEKAETEKSIESQAEWLTKIVGEMNKIELEILKTQETIDPENIDFMIKNREWINRMMNPVKESEGE